MFSMSVRIYEVSLYFGRMHGHEHNPWFLPLLSSPHGLWKKGPRHKVLSGPHTSVQESWEGRGQELNY